MKKTGRYPFYCKQCRERIENISQSFVVDEYGGEPFCSEDCISQFFDPHIHFFEDQERQIREDLHCLEKFSFSPDEEQGLVQSCLEKPDEIWSDKDEFGSKYYYFFIKMGAYQVIAVTLVFDSRPSFLFHHIITQDKKVIEFYQKGIKQAGEGENLKKDEIVVEPGVIEIIEQKKSEYLAQMLELRDDEDIDIEKFGEYDAFFEPTLHDPDETCEGDDDDHKVCTHIKGFSLKGQAFFYYSIFLVTQNPKNTVEDVYIPIFSFPSNSDRVYRFYSKGQKTVEKLLN
jgi:hypothetical protein